MCAAQARPSRARRCSPAAHGQRALAHELAPEASDHDPLDAARAELTDDPSAVTSPDLFELEPELQEAFHDLVNAAVSEPVLSYVLDALAEADHSNYLNFLSASSEWVKP